MSRPIGDCIALLRDPQSAPPDRPQQGLLRLVDGRQFPGEPATPSRTSPEDGGEFAWNSNWLGRIELQLEQIDWLVLPPQPHANPAAYAVPESGQADVVRLSNGDMLNGFITSIDRSIELEIDGDGRVSAMEIPLERIAAINMVSQARDEPSRRAWLSDGAILNLRTLEIDEQGVAQITSPPNDGTGTARLDARHLAAVLLSPSRLVTLAQLQPLRVTGPAARYVVPEPRVLVEDAMLGLSPIELRGPLRVTYALPQNAERVAMEVLLPEQSRTFGDVTLIVSLDETEVARTRLNANQLRSQINVSVSGNSLAIELLEGSHGAIHNHIILNRAMFLLSESEQDERG